MEGHSDAAPAGSLALRERIRLANILARLSSPYENERATAGLLASAFVAKHDMAWSDLTMFLHPLPKAAVAPGSSPPRQERRRDNRRDWRGYCRRRRTASGQVLNLLT